MHTTEGHCIDIIVIFESTNKQFFVLQNINPTQRNTLLLDNHFELGLPGSLFSPFGGCSRRGWDAPDVVTSLYDIITSGMQLLVWAPQKADLQLKNLPPRVQPHMVPIPVIAVRMWLPSPGQLASIGGSLINWGFPTLHLGTGIPILNQEIQVVYL